MINKLVHFSDLHIRLFKDHELYNSIMVWNKNNKALKKKTFFTDVLISLFMEI